MINIQISHRYTPDELTLVPTSTAQVDHVTANVNGWAGMQSVDVIVKRNATADLLTDFLKVNEKKDIHVIGYSFGKFPARFFSSEPQVAAFTADMESCVALALGGRSEKKVGIALWHVQVNNFGVEESIEEIIQAWKKEGIDELVGGLRGGEPGLEASENLVRLLLKVCKRNGVKVLFNETCAQRGHIEKVINGVTVRIPDRSPLGIMATKDLNIQFYKGVAAGAAKTRTRNAFPTPPGIAGPAYLLMRRANGKPFEEKKNIDRLKAGQRGMATTAGQTLLRSANIADDVESCNFGLESLSRAQMDLRDELFRGFYQPDSVFGKLWSTDLRKKISELHLTPDILQKLVSLASSIVASLYTQNAKCYQYTSLNLANQKPNLAGDFPGDKVNEGMHAQALVFRRVTAGDHGWLEIDDVIDDSWAREGVAVFEEDAVFPSSAKATTKDEYDASFVEQLSNCVDELLCQVRASPEVGNFIKQAISSHQEKDQISREAVREVRELEKQGLPIAQTNFMSSERPSVFKSDFRAGARKGLAKMNGKMNENNLFTAAEISATKIGRDWGWSLRQSAKNASRVTAQAQEMAKESRMRRNISGREEVFDDANSPPPDQHLQIIARLSSTTDIDELRQSLWHVHDYLQQEKDQEKLDVSMSELCKWWKNATLSDPMHALVFSIMRNDRIVDNFDITMLHAVFNSLPVFLHMGQPMAPMVVGFLKKGLVERKTKQTAETLAKNSQDFQQYVLPNLKPALDEFRASNQDIYDHVIVPLLQLAMTETEWSNYMES